MSGRIGELVWTLLVFILGFAIGVIPTAMYLDTSVPHTTTHEESLVTTATLVAAQAVIEQGYHFESESAVEGWRAGLDLATNSHAAHFSCINERVCSREEWLIDAVRHFGTLAYESGSNEPVAIWTRKVSSTLEKLAWCTSSASPTSCSPCSTEAGDLLMVALAPPVF